MDDILEYSLRYARIITMQRLKVLRLNRFGYRLRRSQIFLQSALTEISQQELLNILPISGFDSNFFSFVRASSLHFMKRLQISLFGFINFANTGQPIGNKSCNWLSLYLPLAVALTWTQIFRDDPGQNEYHGRQPKNGFSSDIGKYDNGLSPSNIRAFA